MKMLDLDRIVQSQGHIKDKGQNRDFDSLKCQDLKLGTQIDDIEKCTTLKFLTLTQQYYLKVKFK